MMYKKLLIGIILAAVISSCFGIGVGMIGTQVSGMDQSMNMDEAQTGGETAMPCCGIKNQTNMIARLSFDDDFSASILTNGSIISFVYLFIFIVLQGLKVYSCKIHSYIKSWRISIAYFKQQMVMLFSRGILHAKTW